MTSPKEQCQKAADTALSEFRKKIDDIYSQELALLGVRHPEQGPEHDEALAELKKHMDAGYQVAESAHQAAKAACDAAFAS